MTAQEHANAIWRAGASPEALAGAITAYTDELRGELHTLTTATAALTLELEQLRQQLAEAREDVRRLDSLETSNGMLVGIANDCGPTEDQWNVSMWLDYQHQANGYGETLRQAIDAALNPPTDEK